MRPDDGSLVGRESRFGLVQEALDEAGVKLGEWDMVVLGWLANLDIQTVAVITGWVSRARRANVASEDSRLSRAKTRSWSLIWRFALARLLCGIR